MLTFRIAMTAAVMTFDHRDDQAVPPKTVTAEVKQITDLHWLPLPCSVEPAKTSSARTTTILRLWRGAYQVKHGWQWPD